MKNKHLLKSSALTQQKNSHANREMESNAQNVLSNSWEKKSQDNNATAHYRVTWLAEY